MRIPSIYSRQPIRMDVAMTPMIDVVFLLLIFFVWTASFQVVENLLPSSLITAAGNADQALIDPELEDLERVVIRLEMVDAGSIQWKVNGSELPGIQQVRERLEQVAQIRSDLPVLVDPAENVPLGNVIDAYDLTRQLGFSKIQFAAKTGAFE